MTGTQYTEDEVRQLFARATEDIPPDLDLLAGFQARRGPRRFRRWPSLRRPRPRLRVPIAAGAVAAAAITAIAVTLAASPAPAPGPAPSGSAPADLVRAAMITAAQNYRVTLRITPVSPAPGAAQTVTGSFDPARGVGAETMDGSDLARYDGRYIYLRILPTGRKIYQQLYAQQYHLTLRPSQIWERVTEPTLNRSRFLLMTELMSGSVATVQVLSPAGLAAMLKGASQVRGMGPASGPGWTGTAYSFQLSAGIPTPNSKLRTIVTVRGTAGLDQQGRIRSLTGRETSRTPDAPAGEHLAAASISLAFSGFGQPIPASIPPARQVIVRPQK